MSMPMDNIMDNMPYAKAALKKMGEVTEDFRIYKAEWLGELQNPHGMQVTGAEFLRLKRKVNYGKRIPNTERSVYVTRAEIEACK